ncbi:MAG: hypothetical protein LH615_13500 [Ferruginibacter sp.]|nr:hypothetical protein [Ferruginibacter sp.]
MKKFLFSTAILCIAICTKSMAQKEGEFKPFKVDVSLGYALPIGGSGGKGGALFVVEPKYAIMTELSLGLRIEGAFTISGTSDLATGTGNNPTATVKVSSSYLATGDYYFSNNNLRPFAGAGAGIFQTAGVQVYSSNPNIATGSKFGGMLRAGVEYKHGRFGLEYNMVGKTTVAPSSPTSKDGYSVQNSYVGIKFGVVIGGGRE